MSVLEFFPWSFPGLHWEAAADPEDEVPEGFVLAEVGSGRVAVANVDNPGVVLVGTPAHLAQLKRAFEEGRLDFLLAREVTEDD
ncbi:hypothetical protein CFP65_4060 [Kitasatospora sp. MMS16-BH015]|uniref:hypothetical protein n=1 Tax=Kitasatospora sp. MMS16-BH015 TaxID=2018025 RepID=UPI000CA15304|nr:hypothetical protein [Kitasatospora sp. MMS16-BH015]AUG78826.1 hypothetical protein CFP65_4060 [Kitasatospora sp. MMS16-BH015]